MAEYIEREKVYEMLNALGGCGAKPESWADGWDKAIETAIDALSEITAADVLPVVQGHWIPIFLCNSDKWLGLAADYECSECNGKASDTTYSRGLDFEFCPRCGAKMDGKDGE